MRIEHEGLVRNICKNPTDLWCVEVARTKTGTKGVTTYIGIKVKPKLEVGQKVSAGDVI